MPLWFATVKVQLTVVASVKFELKVVVPPTLGEKIALEPASAVVVGSVLSTVTATPISLRRCCPRRRRRSGSRCRHRPPSARCRCWLSRPPTSPVPVKARTVVPLWFPIVKVQLYRGGIGETRTEGRGATCVGTNAALEAVSAVAVGTVLSTVTVVPIWMPPLPAASV